MPLPVSKEELFKNLEKAYKNFDAEFDSIEPKYGRLRNIKGNVSCCDLIAYQLGWGMLLIDWERTESTGETPIMPTERYKWNQLGALAHSFYQKYSEWTLQQLRLEFSNLYQDLVGWINSLSHEELFESKNRQWTGEKWAIVKWIQVNTIAPYKSARTKVRHWKKEEMGVKSTI
ncbi:MAG: hypothetical protein ACI86H_002983 [bacterium]|jgi:hypothetical protein